MYTQPITTYKQNECKKNDQKNNNNNRIYVTHTHTTYKLYNDADDWIVSLWKKEKKNRIEKMEISIDVSRKKKHVISTNNQKNKDTYWVCGCVKKRKH